MLLQEKTSRAGLLGRTDEDCAAGLCTRTAGEEDLSREDYTRTATKEDYQGTLPGGLL